MLKRLLLVAYFIEVGLLLVLVPWSSILGTQLFPDGVSHTAQDHSQ